MHFRTWESWDLIESKYRKFGVNTKYSGFLWARARLRLIIRREACRRRGKCWRKTIISTQCKKLHAIIVTAPTKKLQEQQINKTTSIQLADRSSRARTRERTPAYTWHPRACLVDFAPLSSRTDRSNNAAETNRYYTQIAACGSLLRATCCREIDGESEVDAHERKERPIGTGS